MAGSDYKYVMYDGDLVVFDTHGVNDVRVVSGYVENVSIGSQIWDVSQFSRSWDAGAASMCYAPTTGINYVYGKEVHVSISGSGNYYKSYYGTHFEFYFAELTEEDKENRLSVVKVSTLNNKYEVRLDGVAIAHVYGYDGAVAAHYDWLHVRKDEEDEPPVPPDCQGYGDPIPASPLVLDLDGDGIETVGLAAGIQFDMNNDGFLETTGWVMSDDGFLALDRNGDGIINNGSELFGNSTMLQNGSLAANGFLALAEFDSNHDGKIDKKDSAWNSLRVWRDINQNGESDAGELFTMDQAGISSINLSYTNSNVVDAFGNEFRQVGSFVLSKGNTSRQMVDVWFQSGPPQTGPGGGGTTTIPGDIELLPDAVGCGNVLSLHEAMALDTTGQLQTLVEQFAAETDASARNALLPQIMFLWAGGQASNVIYDYDTYKSIISPEQMGVLEAFWGGRNFSNIISNNHANQLANRYRQLEDMVFYQLMNQTHLSDIYSQISFTYDESLQAWTGDYRFATFSVIIQAQSNPAHAPDLVADYRLLFSR